MSIEGQLKVKVISLPYIFQVLYVLGFTRPRYQVSVYRTIGPLVYSKTGVYRGILFFLFLLKNIDCGYSLEPPH